NANITLAQCLTDKGVKMYGADWCSACQKQKSLFGLAFKKVNYIECDKRILECQQANIRAFPTWIFPDGKRMEGVLPLEQLASLGGCSIDKR
ncbi:MAG: hypothetical protein ACK4NX_01060, partial [Candidatus Paceibacteria bacterium]